MVASNVATAFVILFLFFIVESTVATKQDKYKGIAVAQTSHLVILLRASQRLVAWSSDETCDFCLVLVPR